MSEPIWITLTEAEVEIAALIGTKRHYDCFVNGRRDVAPVPRGGYDNSLERHILGAAGEMAAAKALGRYWGGPVGTFKHADIGATLQVRTRSTHDGELIVRDGDADSHAFVLVTGQVPRFAVRGWMMGADAKWPGWRDERGGMRAAYFVPQDELRSMPEATAP